MRLKLPGREPLALWRGLLLDGHRRPEICGPAGLFLPELVDMV